MLICVLQMLICVLLMLICVLYVLCRGIGYTTTKELYRRLGGGSKVYGTTRGSPDQITSLVRSVTKLKILYLKKNNCLYPDRRWTPVRVD